MFSSSTIFQRTQAGRDEIKQKSHGLTQSERLVLIMIDGVTPFGDVRAKLPALTDERFARALERLSHKELVLEVFMPVEGQVAEELDRSVVDRFLQQDPLDPVTIIMRNPEEELSGHFGSLLPGVPAKFVPPAESMPAVAVRETEALNIPVLTDKTEQLAAMDAYHREMADSLGHEVRQRQAARSVRSKEGVEPPPGIAAFTASTAFEEGRLHWGYWLIGIGCLFIASFFIMNAGG